MQVKRRYIRKFTANQILLAPGTYLIINFEVKE